jgi:hypothetical protein
MTMNFRGEGGAEDWILGESCAKDAAAAACPDNHAPCSVAGYLGGVFREF